MIGGVGTRRKTTARRRIPVAFIKAAELVRDLMEARDERTLGKLHRRLHKVPLLTVDEVGFVPFTRDGAFDMKWCNCASV